MATRRLTEARLAAAVVFALAAGATVASAQTDPRLLNAVQLAQNGMADSARALVKQLQATVQPSDSLYPELLYTSGIVAATAYDRRIALRRVIVEYSTSPWADDALLQLGQDDYANANPGSATAQFSRLIADYPTSPLIPIAAFWGARAAADVSNGAEACRLADIGLAARTEDVELRNQLEFQRQRCSAVASATRDTARTPVVSPPPSPAPASPTRPAADTARPAGPVKPGGAVKGIWVQTIAAPTREKADQTVASLQRIGYSASIVTEGGFFKVRAGPFPNRTDANAAVAKIRTRLGARPFLVVVP